MSDSEEKHDGSESLKKDVNNESHQQQQEGSTTVLTTGKKDMSSSDVEDDMNSEGVQEVVEEDDDDWYEDQGNGWATVKRARKEISINYEEQELVEGDWSPLDVDTTPERETDLMKQIQITTEKLENSESFSVFMNQIKSIQAAEERLCKLTGSGETLRMVIYGVGSFEMYEASRFQLSLALILQRNLDWIGDIEVFDPVLSLTELNVLKKLGLHPLYVNELAKRKVMKPMVFFMPHCPTELYENLLETNWNNELLNKVVILGNSFGKRCEDYRSGSGNLDYSIKHMLALEPFTKEYEVSSVLVDFSHAFHGTSLHTFSVDKDAVLRIAT